MTGMFLVFVSCCSLMLISPKLCSFVLLLNPSDDDGSDDDEVPPSTGDQVLAAWTRRIPKLNTDFAIAAWMLSVKPEVRKDVAERKDGSHHDAMERVIRKMHTKDVNADIDAIVDKFWDEEKHFRNKTGPFKNKGRWASKDVAAGNSKDWHDKYSEPHTEVLGKVAMRTTSKLLGIGSAERAWGDVKHLKDGSK